MPRHRLAAWIVATLTVFVYEGSVIPALLLAALVLTGDAGKTKKISPSLWRCFWDCWP